MFEMSQLPGPHRRAVVAAALTSASVSVASCSGSRESTSSSSAGSGSGGTRTLSATSLPTPEEWRPHENEVEVDCKLTAVRQVVAALTVDGSSSTEKVSPALRPLATQVEGVDQSVVEVVYPQYAGLSLDRRLASVMVVLDLDAIRDDNELTRTSMTLDVRLRRDSSWLVTDVIIPKARQRGTNIPTEVEELLRSSQVALPWEARLDIASGRTDPRLIKLMLELSQRWHLGVHVLRTGHPANVFGTDRTSNHTKGRAVDLWALDRIPVISQDQAPWREVMEAAAALGANEIGGPTDLDSQGPPYFTNAVHQDHLHLAFDD